MSLLRPRIRRYLIVDQGEAVIDEVRKQWAALVLPYSVVGAGTLVLIYADVFQRPLAQLVAWLGIVIALWGFWLVIGERRDVFVITNMRVFRVHGILNQQIATMPLTRILDVSVYKPAVGRLLGYANFVFESAAQAQGLRVIRFVGRPDQRALTIQRVITQAGLRGGVSSSDMGMGTPERAPEPDPAAPPPMPPTPASVEADQRELAWLLGVLRREHNRMGGAPDGGLGSPPGQPRWNPDDTDTAPIPIPPVPPRPSRTPYDDPDGT